MWEVGMTQFEYKVVPAPAKGEKVRGAKTTADRFAVTLTGVMNDLGREGWEYLRADTLPCEERASDHVPAHARVPPRNCACRDSGTRGVSGGTSVYGITGPGTYAGHADATTCAAC
jgi:hypothetical protein